MPSRLLAAARYVALLFIAAGVVAGGLAVAGTGTGAGAATDERVVDILQISGPVDPPVAGAINDLVAQANERGSEAVVIQLDAPGGVAVGVDDVIAPVRSSTVPVIVWIGPGDASAGGAGLFLHAASHIPMMASQATAGPACPPTVSRGCSDGDRAKLAEIVDARVDDGQRVAERLASTSISGAEADELGYVQFTVDGLQPLLVELNGTSVTTTAGTRALRLEDEEVTVRFHSLGLLQRVLHATLSPTFVYLLVVGALVLFAFELFQPGFGVGGVAGLLLAPLAVYGLVVLPVAWWALVLLVAGLALLAVDLAIAGFGTVTVAGTVGVAAGSWWLYASGPGLRPSAWVIAGVTLACVAFFVPIMTVLLRAQAGPDPQGISDELIGKHGVVRSAMNPEGHVFVDGALWRARWTGDQDGKIATGTEVAVHGVDGAVLLVDTPRTHDPADGSG